MDMKSSRCPVAKTQKGAGNGSHMWYRQRLSAIGLIWLTIWFISFSLSLIGDAREEVLERFQHPFNATHFVLFLSFGFYHGWLWVGEIIEDYIHCSCLKGIVKILSLFILLFLFFVSLLSLLKLFIG